MTAFGYKNVGRLDVAMHDPLRVRRIQGIGNLDADRKQRIQLHRTVADEMFQRGAVQVFHDDERFAVLLADVINSADIRMAECRCGSRLAAKSLQRLAILRHIFRQKLECDEAAEARVFRLVNDSHAAAAELLNNAVVGYNLANHHSPRTGLKSYGWEMRQVNRIEIANLKPRRTRSSTKA